MAVLSEILKLANRSQFILDAPYGCISRLKNPRIVYEVYAKWIGDMNEDQVSMLNNQMPTALPPGAPKGGY